ncbi:MAG TPA: aminotransferase class I/II-fold pyridoxal phosphate-dependent enzyme [Paracoccaceae bacterium]|nr:aminotransferase class I/II-fold pyridoxal phosphate-dependent enzyme [Paracoccaceae bacterium]
MDGDRVGAAEAAADHGGGIDSAAARWGGTRDDWLDLSTGINPRPWRPGRLPREAWTALPDTGAVPALAAAARAFWGAPREAAVIAAPGASALIARMPAVAPGGQVWIPGPTYNEHARAFRMAGRECTDDPPRPRPRGVPPNHPPRRRRVAGAVEGAALAVIDESFTDVTPVSSLIALADRPGVVVLKSFGKFWGLAGLRLGFAIGDPGILRRLSDLLGPWPVSGPALAIGTAALRDAAWAGTTRWRLTRDAARLDRLMAARGARIAGGTDLFRLYEVDHAALWADRLAHARILIRTFPYSRTALRLGLPGRAADWARLEAAL